MSGFFGIFSPTEKVNKVAFDQMLEYARKGSFDEVETVETDHISMGHMMLRVSPEAEYDQQPLQSDCGRYLLTGHFRLDYRDELGDKLGFGFQELKKMPDSLLALLAFQKWKENCVHHLEGDWAFVLHDKKNNKLFMAKDKTGVSALFHIKLAEQVFFASDTATILSVISKDVEIDDDVFFRYAQLGNYPEGGRTLISGLQYINNAEYLAYDNLRKKKSFSYWSLENIPPIRFHFEEDYVHGLFSVYSAAIRSRLHTDKEIGLFLSGGLDSTSVASLAAMELQTEGRTLNTYTSFPHYESMLPVSEKIISNEVPLVQDLAKRYENLRPYFFDFPDASLKDQFYKAQTLDAYYPIVSKNSFWINGIMKEAREKSVGRILTGQLGNYTITWTTPYVYAALFFQFRYFKLFKEIKRDFPRSEKPVIIFIVDHLLRPIKARLFSVFTYPKSIVSLTPLTYLNIEPQKHMLSLESNLKKIKINNLWKRPNYDRESQLTKLISFVGIKWALEAQKNGIEIADPTSDLRVLSYTLSIPESLFYKPGYPKYIYKQMINNIIPDSILTNSQFKLQSHDFSFRIQEDSSFYGVFKAILSSKHQTSPINLNALSLLYNQICDQPSNFTKGVGVKVFLHVFSLYQFSKNLFNFGRDL